MAEAGAPKFLWQNHERLGSTARPSLSGWASWAWTIKPRSQRRGKGGDQSLAGSRPCRQPKGPTAASSSWAEKPSAPGCLQPRLQASPHPFPASLLSPSSFSPSDIAIAAPYGGEDKKGIVYIFNGRPTGLNAVPSQILEGKWAARSMPPSFGYSMKGATDIDKNGYPGAS